MKLLKQEQAVRQELFKYFGYKEDWRVLPFDDCTKYFWRLVGGEGHGGSVQYAKTQGRLHDENDAGDYYESEIYSQRHLPKWVYRGKEFTMIVVDTHTDGNQLLQIFTNAKEVTE
jgi:hypothetical protein